MQTAVNITPATTVITSPKNIAYLRVSTVAQDLENQRHGVLDFIAQEGIKPVEFVQEKVTGKISVSERDLGRKVIPALQQGDALIVSELSRLGRNMVEIMGVLDELIKKGVRIYAVKGGYRLDGSLSSKILSMVLLMAAEIERELISQRTREALSRRKSEGKPLGRPKGSYGTSKLDKHGEQIQELVSCGVSKAAIGRMFGATWQTVDTWIRRNGGQRDVDRA